MAARWRGVWSEAVEGSLRIDKAVVGCGSIKVALEGGASESMRMEREGPERAAAWPRRKGRIAFSASSMSRGFAGQGEANSGGSVSPVDERTKSLPEVE